MAQALTVPGTPGQAVQHVYRVDPLQLSRPHRRSHTTHLHLRPRRNSHSLNSYHRNGHEHGYLNSLIQRHTLRYATTDRPTSDLLGESYATTPLTPPASPRSCVHSFQPPRKMPIVENVHHEASLPSSPPDLTESKSSKSSGSFRSSCLTDTTGPENLSHFEEIALADSGRDSDDLQTHHVVSKAPVKPAPPQQRSSSGHVYTHNAMVSSDALRDTTNLLRPPYPGMKNKSLRDQQRRASTGRQMPLRRNFTTPSTISVNTMNLPNRDQSSSRSPSPHSARSSTGSRSPRSSASRSNSFASTHRSLARKSATLQPRKTIQELEAEYHDSDEEVPEDAVIWNVPISPRPPFGQSQPSSRKNSMTVSQVSLSADAAQKRASNSSVRPTEAPSSPRRPGMPHSATVASFPPDTLAMKPRTKSWTMDLSEEARELTAALEAHAEEERESSDRRQSPSSSPPRPSQKLRSKTSIMELPPLQKGNIMIDPLPISKEKEAVLTRTRPSWLPPKSQKEERKHVREWERMMARAAEAEKRREQKQLEEQREKKYMEHNIAKIWDQHVLPNWNAVVREPRTRELWWRGITPRSRGVVWAKAIGNELSLTEASYTAALGRAKALQASVADLSTEEQKKHKDGAWIAAITRDVPTVLPEVGLFGVDAPLHDTLVDVLLAYAAYRSDVGYVYGTHSLAGLLVLNLPTPSEAFVALANLLNRPMALAYLVNDHASIKRIQSTALSTLKYKMPKLHEHLTDKATGVHLDEWLSPFLMTMGTMHLSPEACARVWDVAVFEGDKAFVRATVGVLSLLESKLYGSRDESLAILGWGAEKWAFREEEVMIAAREAGKVSHSPERKP